MSYNLILLKQLGDLLQTMDIAVNISLKIWHAPAPINKEETDGQEDLEDCSGEVAPVAHVAESERLEKMRSV